MPTSDVFGRIRGRVADERALHGRRLFAIRTYRWARTRPGVRTLTGALRLIRAAGAVWASFLVFLVASSGTRGTLSESCLSLLLWPGCGRKRSRLGLRTGLWPDPTTSGSAVPAWCKAATATDGREMPNDGPERELGFFALDGPCPTLARIVGKPRRCETDHASSCVLALFAWRRCGCATEVGQTSALAGLSACAARESEQRPSCTARAGGHAAGT